MNKYNWGLVDRSVLERLAARVSEYAANMHDHGESDTLYLDPIEEARRQAKPELRSKAEVDSDLADEVRREFSAFKKVELGSEFSDVIRKLCEEEYV